MADAGASIAGNVSVQIGGNLAPFQAALAQAEAMATAFDAKVSAILGSAGGGSSAFTATTAAANDASAAIAQVTAPAAAASAAIDKIAATSTAAATGIDAAAASMDTGGINAKALAAALALTGNNLEKATALMVANADAAKAQAAATETVTAATVALASAQAESGVVGSAGTLVQTTSAAKALDAELGNTAKLSASASAEILRIGNDAARGNFGRLTSAAVVLSTRLGEGGAEALTFRNVLTTFGGLADVLFNPVLIALIGIPVALDLAVKGFEALSNGGKSLNDVLKEQKTYLDDLAQSFPEAGKAAQDFLKIASAPSTAQASQQGFQSSFDLQNQQNAARQSIEEQLRSALNPAGNGPDLAAQYRDADVALGDLSGNFRKFLQDFVAGKTDAAQLSNELSDMYVSASPQERGIISQFETWLETIQKTQAGIDANTLAATRLTTAYQQLALAAADRKNELAATDSITKSLQFQISTLGQSNTAVASAKEYQAVWNAGIEHGATDLQELASQAASAAGQVASLTSSMIAANANSDLKFSISLVGLSTAQQAAAKALRAPGQADANAVLGQPGGSDTVVNDTLNEFISLTKKADPASKQAAADLDALGKSGAIPAATMATLNQRLKDYDAATQKIGSTKVKALDPFQQAMQSAKDDTANLVAQQQALGLTSEQADKLTESQKLLNEATKKGTDLSGPQLAAIDAAATAYAAQKAQLNALTQIYDLGQSTFQDFFSTLKSGFENGETAIQSFGDAAAKVLDDLGNKALQMASDGIWNSIFGGLTGGGGGNWLTSLFGGSSSGLAAGAGLNWASAAFPAFASGTNSAPGGVALVGEQGPELVRLPAGAQVRNAAQTAAMFNAAANGGTNDNGLTIHVNVDARGAQQGAGAEIATALTSFARNQMPNLVRQANANPYRRGYVPYPTGS